MVPRPFVGRDLDKLRSRFVFTLINGLPPAGIASHASRCRVGIARASRAAEMEQMRKLVRGLRPDATTLRRLVELTQRPFASCSPARGCSNCSVVMGQRYRCDKMATGVTYNPTLAVPCFDLGRPQQHRHRHVQKRETRH
jgi:hypothetical protein